MRSVAAPRAQWFLRIHRTYAVDLEHVGACRPDARDLVAESKDGTRLPVRWAQAQEMRDSGV
jgi:DNA-binding LytR/AlgR family response regulator